MLNLIQQRDLVELNLIVKLNNALELFLKMDMHQEQSRKQYSLNLKFIFSAY